MNKHVYILALLLISNTLLAGEWIAVGGGIIEINKIEIEENLWRHIKKSSDIRFEARDKYTYQYKSVNDNEIFINALCDTWDRNNLSKELVIVFDGGSCYFQLMYNIKTGKFSELRVNGEA